MYGLKTVIIFNVRSVRLGGFRMTRQVMYNAVYKQNPIKVPPKHRKLQIKTKKKFKLQTKTKKQV